MILRYIYSACIVIETSDLRICCDPWFTQGIYDGTWFQHPEIEDPIGQIGPVDFVYISHIHPDHYDPPYLRQLIDANPDCQIIIGDQNQSFLRAKMQRDGFSPRPISRLTVGQTEVAIFPNFADSEINIDSALVVKNSQFSIVNMNDCAFDQRQVDLVIEFCGGTPDIACLPYAGAGPYPQAYRFDRVTERQAAADRKREQFLWLFKQYLDALAPRHAVPFAGLYYLGGSRRWMNPLRGVPDALEVVERFGDCIVVLEEAVGSINLAAGQIVNRRVTPYDDNTRTLALDRFDDYELPYEHDAVLAESDLVNKLSVAHRRACERLVDAPMRWLCFKTPATAFLCVHPEQPGEVKTMESTESLKPREEFYIDGRLFAGLLERRYHWNNAEIGSHFEFKRTPEQYDRRVYNLLNFLHA